MSAHRSALCVFWGATLGAGLEPLLIQGGRDALASKDSGALHLSPGDPADRGVADAALPRELLPKAIAFDRLEARNDG